MILVMPLENGQMIAQFFGRTPHAQAVDKIAQMRREKRGGISLYQKDATGKYLLFYCHFSRYVKGMRAGASLAESVADSGVSVTASNDATTTGINRLIMTVLLL